MTTARAAMARHMTEDELLQAITDAATYLGWRWHHVRRSDKALQMGSPGFPDLVLARNGRVLFLELKGRRAKFRPGQLEWIGATTLIPADERVQAFVIRPDNLDFALGLLR